MNTPTKEEILSHQNGTKFFIKREYTDFYNYLLENYREFNIKFNESLYWFYHNIYDYPKCSCGNRLTFHNFKDGYYKHCSPKCSRNDKSVKEKQILTCFKKYGCSNPFANEIIKNKIKKKNIDKYGVEYPMQSKEIQEKSAQTCQEKYGVSHYSESQEHIDYIKTISDKMIEKRNQTNMIIYGVTDPMKLKSVKNKKSDTCKRKYGDEWFTKTKYYKDLMTPEKQKIKNDHMFETKRKNGTLNTSSIELQFKSWLDENNVKYEFQYNSPEYPFVCDFWFPENELYFEIQGWWGHGHHPYEENNELDKTILNKWNKKLNETNSQFYKNAIKTWSIQDPRKREWVKNNNLNWVEVFSTKLEDVIKAYKNALL